MAKAFHVYCFEYSIGLGPKLFSIKRKNQETKFSLRAIPFGGYVSMYGEEGSLPEGVEVDPSRSLNSIKKWKRAIILAAGVIMNVILAFVLFFICNSCFPYNVVSAGTAIIKDENSIAYNAGIRDQDNIYLLQYDETAYAVNAIKLDSTKDDLTFYGQITYLDQDKNQQNKPVGAFLSRALIDFNDYSWDRYIVYYCLDENNKIDTTFNCSDFIKDGRIYANPNSIISLEYNINVAILNQEENKYNLEEKHIVYSPNEMKELDENNKFKFKSLGIEFFHEERWNSFGEIFTKTFADIGNGSVAIVRGLISLFTPNGWQNIGGIISIAKTSTSTLINFGFGNFLSLWGVISINLAIVNLLPFPGLDGWQLLVLVVEAIAHKQIPNKVKSIISFVGIAILILFMVLVLIKDIIFW